MKSILVTTIFILSISNSGISQDLNAKYMITPSISAGYTFGAGINFGFTIDFGFKQTQQNNGQTAWMGVSFSKYWNRVSSKYGHKVDIHRINALNLLYESDNFKLRTGLGMARNPWGYGNNNYCRVGGFYTDLVFTNLIKPQVPDIGFKGFFYPRSKWRWFDLPYLSIYGKYEKSFAIIKN
jgi:hypothetical protein